LRRTGANLATAHRLARGLGKGVKAGEGDPLERSGQPEEVAPAYIFAFNVDSSYITGEVLTLLGEEQRTA
jgi:NAD(P)-dependent dehydrogenase (short-subunit alcohol dehydrogenase family)